MVKTRDVRSEREIRGKSRAEVWNSRICRAAVFHASLSRAQCCSPPLSLQGVWQFLLSVPGRLTIQPGTYARWKGTESRTEPLLPGGLKPP